ncbi:histone H1.0-A [Drosophila rhopaloa]|uniref:H15 domain-containing protein n=1 Tax=Drosophila rhopaloa TaxID=1041015 RepID=A0ABM5HBC6_DRORH|nr:histone H1.0-A [Drosophila rhopaloa]
MKLKRVDDSSDDEGEEEMQSDNPQEDSNLGEEEQEMEEEDDGEEDEGDEDEGEEEMEEEEEEEQREGEEPESDNLEAVRHPYPTPPPDDGSKMAPPDSGKDKKPKSNAPKVKESPTSLALMAIGKLSSRSGSSVRAIMTYLKNNGHEWKDAKKAARIMYRALKLAVTSGDVVMVKRSFKLTEKYKNSSKAEEKMKAKKQKEKAKKAMAEKVVKEKAEKKLAKSKEKKANKEKAERKTNQVGKKKKAEGEAKTAPPKKKAAAGVKALLQTPEPATNGKKAAKSSVKKAAESSEVGKSKKPRKSIGTLAQPKTSRPKVKAVKKLVAAKEAPSAPETTMAGFSEAQATSTPTPQGPTKEKRKRKVQL